MHYSAPRGKTYQDKESGLSLGHEGSTETHI